MKPRYVCTWSANVGDIDGNKLRFGYSGMRFQIRVSIQGSGTRISGYPLRSLLKAVFLALKEFQSFCCNKTVLIATDNTTVVAYINKEGGGG